MHHITQVTQEVKYTCNYSVPYCFSCLQVHTSAR